MDDLEKFAKEAEAKGYPLSDGPHSTGSGKIAFIDAPEGYEIELIERARKTYTRKSYVEVLAQLGVLSLISDP